MSRLLASTLHSTLETAAVGNSGPPNWLRTLPVQRQLTWSVATVAEKLLRKLSSVDDLNIELHIVSQLCLDKV